MMLAFERRPHGSWRRRADALRVTLLGLLMASGCALGPTSDASLAPIEMQTGRVGEALRVPLIVLGNPSPALRFDFRSPPGLVNLDAEAAGTGDGGEFRWVPTSAHVGRHEFTFLLLSSSGSELDRSSAILEIFPGEGSAPVFLRPGSGATSGASYDVEEDPLVTFDIEVRDLDSPEVEIRFREPPPDGANSLRPSPDGKRARFEWRPSTAQVQAFDSWVIALEADDFVNEPVPHDHRILFR